MRANPFRTIKDPLPLFLLFSSFFINTEEILGFEACAADESSIDVFFLEEISDIFTLDGTTVEDADIGGGFLARDVLHRLTDEGTDRFSIFRCR